MSGITFPVPIVTQMIVRPNLGIYYPMVAGITDTNIQRFINMEIYKLVNELITKQGFYENPMTQMSGWYEIKTNEKEILCLSIYDYAFAGGAHGNTLQKSLTFDITIGKSYELNELFKKGSNYVKKLSDIVGIQIKERQLSVLGEYQGISPRQDYYVADKTLVLYFQLYEIVPYVYGFPYFPVSIYSIQDIILEDGPLGKML